MFIVRTQLSLCKDQTSQGAVLLRPSDVWSSHLFDFSISARHIQQRVVSDCSVCASIAVCIEHHRRFGSKVGKLPMFRWLNLVLLRLIARIIFTVPTRQLWSATICGTRWPLQYAPHVQWGISQCRFVFSCICDIAQQFYCS